MMQQPQAISTATRNRAFIIALISSATFGMVPFFAVPAQRAGMTVSSLLVYRYAFASLVLLIPVIYTHTSLKLTFKDFLKLFGLGTVFVGTSVTQFLGFKYMDTGAATALQYSYPIFAPILTYFMYKEKLTVRVAVAIVLAIFGCICLSGVLSEPSQTHEHIMWGVLLELGSGLLFAIYLVLIPNCNFDDKRMNSSKLTFYVYAFGFIITVLFALCQGGIEWLGNYSAEIIIKIIILSLLPSAFATITLNMSVKIIGSTLSSILSTMEPVTAMILGVLFLGDQPDMWASVGFVVIIAAVMLIVIKTPDLPKAHGHQKQHVKQHIDAQQQNFD